MKLRLSAPSKTFLLGEYLVLKGGRALVLATKPRFILAADSSGRGIVDGIHPSSPAGRLIEDNQAIFNRWDLRFNDPHEGAGGFGASSAQFLFAHAVLQMATGALDAKQLRTCAAELPVAELWKTYRAYAETGAGLPPSGADVLAQAMGRVARVEISAAAETPAKARSLEWKFENFGFFLVRTGRKVATHQHLRKLDDIETEELRAALTMGEKAFEANDGELLASAVTLYQDALFNLGLVAQESTDLIEALASTEAVAAVKGCGALGADVLFVMFEKGNEAIVRDRLNLLQLPIVATENDICEGLKLTIDRTRVVVKGVSV